MALSDAAIRAAKPTTKPYKMYDRDGLFLLINPGGSKLWRWRYRIGGKEKLMALGEYPIVTLAEAREDRLYSQRRSDEQLEKFRPQSTPNLSTRRLWIPSRDLARIVSVIDSAQAS